VLQAIDRSQATIAFDLNGIVLEANENFLKTMGYSLGEIVGKHHRMFVLPDEAASEDYRRFWEHLREGRFVAATFQRVARGGREVWLQASYNPVLDAAGRPIKIVKLAADITDAQKAVQRAQSEKAAVDQARSNVRETLADRLARLAAGDLTARIESPLAEGFKQIGDDYNAAVDQLRATMTSVAEATYALKNGSDEIASASDDLSRRTEHQAASLEQTAAALDQITATVRRSADGAKRANAASTEAKHDATRSGQVMGEAVTAMSEIEQSSHQISQIIGVIDEIAFQTNLLALNAGVEAARAGDAGRGFAVVAQEVRALAQRSADAAKEIKALIASSSEQVQRGVRLVDDTGQALTGIVVKVTEIDALIAEIARSSQEQAVGLAQVNSAVNQMDQVTQQNAAMVEETTAAATSLRGEADALTRMVSGFQVGGAKSAGRDAGRQDARALQARVATGR
jgi:methyl-accepting chemotaxis protein